MHFSGSFLKAVSLTAILLPFSICSPATELVAKRQPTCKDVVIPISVSAKTITLAPTTTYLQAVNLVTNTVSALVELLFGTLVQRTYNIAGTYCEPANYVASRTNTIQFLIHGATVNARYYWSGDGPIGAGFDGTSYSWIDYASQQGYPTFAMDRIGSGLSTHPDPILVVQIPTQAQIAHGLITLMKSGASPFPRAFKKVIVVGHSMGSVITQSLSVSYPQDAEAVILTGYSRYIVNIVAGIFTTAVLLPADISLPSEYADLPVGYLVPNSFSGILYLFWYDPHANGTYYDPAFASSDYGKRQCITVGEGATAAVAAATSAMTGNVLVVTGEQDTLFCGQEALPINGPGQCVGGSLNYLAGTGSLYPQADYSYFSVPNAGHLWQYHFAAQEGFAYVHNWLASRGY
ncbi:hypothetical protein D0Z07_6799 [Hyphodiscus hymeniophilus]|uniref:Serine aminopeptidase S33 domain-containing protein n=1 Tax=Hyphodiscus hymeniophilus TaxID=353542 RepID=A0A9P7AVD5_9HELO|nr:hypothetical protein D0Z07_6799 [Hyphodiscus hymeniophilus]